MIERGAEGTFASPPPKERERGGRSSVPLLSISAFIHSPVKCNKSLYIFTRCIVFLVYLITFELLKQSTINQKTKWYYNHLDINFIKIHPFYKHSTRILGTGADTLNSVQASYFERFHWPILNFWALYRPWSMTATEHGTASSAVCSVQKFKIDQWKHSK
jgi:hypothetical protein